MANPSTSNEFKLLNVNAAAKFLGGEDSPISKSTLSQWRAKGIGPAYIKVGNSIRYCENDLRRFIKTECQLPKQPQVSHEALGA